MEDGSTDPCEDIALSYASQLDLRYFYKANEGRSIARNYGLEHATGQYFVFFDSDCVIPPDYFKTLGRELANDYVPCFGGPDAASDEFTDVQKAISFSMTSFLTTGGIRGGKVQMEKFVPRSFNMGYSREVYEKVGGFREMFSEDIDMSTRVRQAGFNIRLIRPAFVYHKRRTSISKFRIPHRVRAAAPSLVVEMVVHSAHPALCSHAVGSRPDRDAQPQNRLPVCGY